ncbi:unnamed protein product, partial [Ectocarpus sp. 12 AP-2014]
EAARAARQLPQMSLPLQALVALRAACTPLGTEGHSFSCRSWFSCDSITAYVLLAYFDDNVNNNSMITGAIARTVRDKDRYKVEDCFRLVKLCDCAPTKSPPTTPTRLHHRWFTLLLPA